MFEITLSVSGEDALARCLSEGLVVALERTVPGDPAGRQWHLRFPGRRGTLELTSRRGRVWLKVHDRRDGGWARDLAAHLGRRLQ